MACQAESGQRQNVLRCYPPGFLQRACALLGVRPDDAVPHVCAGMVRQYPYDGLGPNDKTLDLDPTTQPDFLANAREPYPGVAFARCNAVWTRCRRLSARSSLSG